MANYYASSRTNYLRVKDEEAFLAWAEKFGLQVVTSSEYPEHFALLPNEMGDGYFSLYDPDNDDYGAEEADFMDELARHLVPGSVAVMIEAGAEKLRYITGFAVAIDHTGKRVDVNLSDIYDKAFGVFGVRPTYATY